MPQGVAAGGSTTITNDSVGKAIVSPIVFNKADTYTYIITEIKPDDADAGISYDTGTVTATVTVTRDDTTNELKAEVSYSKEASDGTVTTGTGSNAFANRTIAPKPVDVTISAKKTLDGRTGFADDVFRSPCARTKPPLLCPQVQRMMVRSPPPTRKAAAPSPSTPSATPPKALTRTR